MTYSICGLQSAMRLITNCLLTKLKTTNCVCQRLLHIVTGQATCKALYLSCSFCVYWISARATRAQRFLSVRESISSSIYTSDPLSSQLHGSNHALHGSMYLTANKYKFCTMNAELFSRTILTLNTKLGMLYQSAFFLTRTCK